MGTNETPTPPRAELRATRVSIRPYVAADAQALLDLRQTNKDFFAPYEPSSVVLPQTVAEQRERLAAEGAEWDAGRRYTFGIFTLPGDELVGQVQLSHVTRGALQNANLGYFIGEAANGKGYATAATRLALDFAFDVADLHRVQAGTLRDNRRSMRVLEKAGFRREGTALRYLEIKGVWEDHEIFAITREEWRGDVVT